MGLEVQALSLWLWVVSRLCSSIGNRVLRDMLRSCGEAVYKVSRRHSLSLDQALVITRSCRSRRGIHQKYIDDQNNSHKALMAS
jgi:hypothetical protein